MAGLGESRMVGNAAFQSQPAKPPVCQVEIDLLAQPPLGADAEAVTHDQYADHQFRIDRGPADRAVERRQSLPQRAEVEKPVDLAQQVTDWNPILKAKLIKQLRPIFALLPHHGRCPRSAPKQYGITADSRLQPTSSTKSANSGHRICPSVKPSCSTQSRRSLAGGDDTCLKYELGRLCFGCPRRRLDVLRFGQPGLRARMQRRTFIALVGGLAGWPFARPRPAGGFRGSY